MPKIDLDNLFSGLLRWFSSGNAVEDVWLFLRRPYVTVLRQVGWSRWGAVHHAQKELTRSIPFVSPRYTLVERAGQEPWSWVILLGPFVCVLILAERAGLFPGAVSGGEMPSADYLGHVLLASTLVGGLFLGVLLMLVFTTLKSTTPALEGDSLLFVLRLRHRGVIPATAFVMGAVVTDLYGYCFRSVMAPAVLHSYSYMAMVLTLVSVVVLAILLLRTFQTSAVVQGRVLLEEHQAKQRLALFYHQLLLQKVTVGEPSIQEQCEDARLALLATAFYIHGALEAGESVTPWAPQVQYCIERTASVDQLLEICTWPGVLDTSVDNAFSRTLCQLDSRYPQSRSRRLDVLRFALLHLALKPETMRTPGQPTPSTVTDFLRETTGNQYMIYALFEGSVCGLTEDQISQAQKCLAARMT